MLEEQHAAQQAELFAQQRVDLASQQAHGSVGNGNVGNGNNGHRPQGHGGAVLNSHSTPAPTVAATTSPAVASSSPAGATTITTTTTVSPTQSQAEQRAAATEQAYNQAKLDLAAAEDSYETKRAVAEEVTVTVRAEATRLESLERVQLVVRISFYHIVVFCVVIFEYLDAGCGRSIIHLHFL